MKKIEFYTLNDEVWVRTEDENQRFTPTHPLVEQMANAIEELYPKAYSALLKEYQRIDHNPQYKRFRIVQRFIKCNFGEIDNVLDISSYGRWVFECVKCPLRGECKFENVICQPEFNSGLSKREKEILKYVYDGLSVEDISIETHLSPHTVNNHIRNAFAKLDVHSKTEFIVYANNNGMYSQERIK